MWGEPDDFGVPGNAFGYVPEDFIRALGRVVMLSALVENLFSHVIMTLAGVSEEKIAGQPMGQLIAEFDRIAGYRTPTTHLLEVKAEVESLLERRNELVHSLWPRHSPDGTRGWRPVTARKREGDEYIKWIEVSDVDLRQLIAGLVAVHTELQRLFGTADLTWQPSPTPTK